MNRVDPHMAEFHQYMMTLLGNIKGGIAEETCLTLVIRNVDRPGSENAIFVTEETDVSVPIAIMQDLDAGTERGAPVYKGPVDALSPEVSQTAARGVDAILNRDAFMTPADKRWGFGLLMFEMGQAGPQACVYVSNAEREFMRAAIRRWLAEDESAVDLRSIATQGAA